VKVFSESVVAWEEKNECADPVVDLCGCHCCQEP
jgi:hypothetical protein